MTRGNLLRHIFRHGPNSKLKRDAVPAKDHENERSPLIAKSSAHESKPLSQDQSPPRTPEPHTVHVLPEITEEGSSSPTAGSPSASPSTGSTVSDLASIVTVLAAHAPLINPATLTTRDLLYAGIDEAISATKDHLDTLATAWALLEALVGFSATVEVLKQEMEVKITASEAKLVELESFEEAVDGMTFPDEQDTTGADGGDGDGSPGR
ncbi:hypothetical protein J4E90_000056 [Alternaria incomplexa]|uniref:uncharacterized protein n=1 Tax=Alternaria incomplexa TaxID=1187928 RepID=UPI00221F9543|nr:uncharacterized protein J4E90_000056 [Alternaria incomplexa]KAI4921630.1 hypothetical protein J4E90_000056 [Alternaria incomplexa]